MVLMFISYIYFRDELLQQNKSLFDLRIILIFPILIFWIINLRVWVQRIKAFLVFFFCFFKTGFICLFMLLPLLRTSGFNFFKIDKHEIELIGGWENERDQLVENEVTKMINLLIENYLVKIDSDSSGTTVINCNKINYNDK